MRKVVAFLLAGAAAVFMSGCVEFVEDVQLKRTGPSTVTLTAKVCEEAGSTGACGDAEDGGQDYTAVLGLRVPDTVTGPESVVTSGNMTLTLKANQADADHFTTHMPPPEGYKWLAYRSPTFKDGEGAQRAEVSVPLTIPDGYAGELYVSATLELLHGNCNRQDNDCIEDHSSDLIEIGPGPAIAVTTPTDGATYSAGDEVAADFACTDAAVCTGTVADGQAIDTATAGKKTFTVNAEDADGNPSSATVSYSVAPAVALTGATTANEGTRETYTYSLDPADAQVTESCGTEGTRIDTPAERSFDCAFPDGTATSTVSVTAVAAGVTGTDSLSVAIADVAPTFDLGGDTAVDEGQTKTYSYTVSDPGDDPEPATAESCGTGGTKVDTAASHSFDCTFPDGPATSEVAVSATDGPPASDAVSVSIADVAPTYDLSGATSADEGETKTYSYTVSDPGDDPGPATAESCGTRGTKVDTAASRSFRCTFPDGPATSTIAVSATEGPAADDELTATVANLAPTAAGDAYEVDEDTKLTTPAPGVLANDSDPGADSLTAQVVEGPARGTLTLTSDGGLSYVPKANFAGTDGFTYAATDGDAASAPVAVTITVRKLEEPKEVTPEDASNDTPAPVQVVVPQLEAPQQGPPGGFLAGAPIGVSTAFDEAIGSGGVLGARLRNANPFPIAVRLSLQLVRGGSRARSSAARRRTLATTTVRLAPGESRRTRLRLSRSERRAIRRKGSRLVAVLKVRDPGGGLRRSSRPVRVGR